MQIITFDNGDANGQGVNRGNVLEVAHVRFFFSTRCFTGIDEQETDLRPSIPKIPETFRKG